MGRAAVVAQVAAGAKVAAEVASRMKKVVAMGEVVVVKVEAMEVAAGALKRTAVAMEVGALMLKAAVTDAGVGASKRLAAVKMAVVLKAFDPRGTSKSEKGGLRVCWSLKEDRRRSDFLFPCWGDHYRRYR